MNENPYKLTDDGIVFPSGQVVPLACLGTDIRVSLLLQMLKTAYSEGAVEEAKAAMKRTTAILYPDAYTEPEHKKALASLASDIGLGHSWIGADPDSQEAAQVQRTLDSTIDRLRKNPMGEQP